MDFLNYGTNLTKESSNFKRKPAYLESTYHHLHNWGHNSYLFLFFSFLACFFGERMRAKYEVRFTIDDLRIMNE